MRIIPSENDRFVLVLLDFPSFMSRCFPPGYAPAEPLQARQTGLEVLACPGRLLAVSTFEGFWESGIQ